MVQKHISLTFVALFALGALGACMPEQKPTVRSQQAEAAAKAANSLTFSDNAEIDNIKRRLTLTANPGQIGFIVLLNEAGQPIMYEGVTGKVTSGGKRLTTPDQPYVSFDRGYLRQAPSDEGTYGSSSPYIFYWNTAGEYRQWSGAYLYSDKPLRLRVEPLVVSIQGGK